MKAEHRKELQTNLLADRMGRLLQNVKAKPSRRGVLIGAAVVAVLVALATWWFLQNRGVANEQERWVQFEQTTDLNKLKETATDYPNSNQAKAARLQLNYIKLWEGKFAPLGVGLKHLMAQPIQAYQALKECKEEYEKLAEECKEDPIFGSEAMYGLAVVEETMTCFLEKKEDVTQQLDKALKAYDAVVEKFPKGGFSGQAEKRAAELRNPDSRKRIETFYVQVHGEVAVFLRQDELRQKFKLPPQHP
jgi:hypothetical protein